MADASFKQDFLHAHNAYRAKHSAPPLTLSTDLSATAQNWANHLLSRKSLEHSSTENGENLFYKYASTAINLKGKEAVDSWYSEIDNYNWKSPKIGSDTGHFTQVVWKSTTEVGVGLATDGHTVIVVGQYRPAGNIDMTEYIKENILPLAGREIGGADDTSNGGPPKKTCTLL